MDTSALSSKIVSIPSAERDEDVDPERLGRPLGVPDIDNTLDCRILSTATSADGGNEAPDPGFAFVWYDVGGGKLSSAGGGGGGGAVISACILYGSIGADGCISSPYPDPVNGVATPPSAIGIGIIGTGGVGGAGIELCH